MDVFFGVLNKWGLRVYLAAPPQAASPVGQVNVSWPISGARPFNLVGTVHMNSTRARQRGGEGGWMTPATLARRQVLFIFLALPCHFPTLPQEDMHSTSRFRISVT
jgi:hypothetical protein